MTPLPIPKPEHQPLRHTMFWTTTRRSSTCHHVPVQMISKHPIKRSITALGISWFLWGMTHVSGAIHDAPSNKPKHLNEVMWDHNRCTLRCSTPWSSGQITIWSSMDIWKRLPVKEQTGAAPPISIPWNKWESGLYYILVQTTFCINNNFKIFRQGGIALMWRTQGLFIVPPRRTHSNGDYRAEKRHSHLRQQGFVGNMDPANPCFFIW